MPKEVITAPGHDRARSLGWLAVHWMEKLLVHGTGGMTGEPLVLGDDSVEFIVDAYALDANGDRLYDSAFYSAPKGTDKSGLAARIELFEAVGPCRTKRDEHGRAMFATGGELYHDPWGLGFVYKYSPGEPMGDHLVNPQIRCQATKEEQTENTYATVLYNFQQGPLSAILDHPGDAANKGVKLPRGEPTRGGSIVPTSVAGRSNDGGQETHVTFDETHLYTTPRVKETHHTLIQNLNKRRSQGHGSWYLETTTMYAPGERSVAEDTYDTAMLMKSGKLKQPRLLFHHRYGDVDLTDKDLKEEDLRRALTEAFGEATLWTDVDVTIANIQDPRSDVAESSRLFLNQITSRTSSWMQPVPWSARSRPEYHPDVPPPTDGDTIALGFDGSRGRTRGYADATALVATRIDDGLQWLVDAWQQPEGTWGWEVPVHEVDAAVAETFDRYKVVAFFADPSGWEPVIADWEARYGMTLPVRSGGGHYIAAGMTGGKAPEMGKWIDEYKLAVENGDMYHNDDATLTRHVLNAVARPDTRYTILQKPEGDASPRKIDAAIAAVYSWKARLKALTIRDVEPLEPKKKPATFVPTVHGRGRGPRRRNRNRRARLI